ncbi:putative vesicle-associated membrane protein 726 isoform X1 [Camponotus floridanus]|uniref:putative vesicle-associated membrane protein 726 isoform X1 n=1 Tax=Camponotus floridanus TaxID=104421 RepID=UPI00059DCB1A|nr:putative vesicle-associated membrane protein 726 isoform X1 [Camponotus floridanus]
METNGTVHYALVALWEKTGCRIVADYPADQDPIYRALTLSTVDGLKTVEDEKISVDRGKYTVHVLIGELHYACLTSKSNCPTSAIQIESCSQIFLQKLRDVYRELPILADLSKDLTNLAVADFSKPLRKIIEEYNCQDINSKSLISRLEEDLAEIRGLLMDGVQKLIDRGEKLDELLRKTQSLEISTRDFHVVTRIPEKKKKNVFVAAGGVLLIIISQINRIISAYLRIASILRAAYVS